MTVQPNIGGGDPQGVNSIHPRFAPTVQVGVERMDGIGLEFRKPPKQYLRRRWPAIWSAHKVAGPAKTTNADQITGTGAGGLGSHSRVEAQLPQSGLEFLDLLGRKASLWIDTHIDAHSQGT